MNQGAATNKEVADSATLENSIQVAMFLEQATLGGMLEIEMAKLVLDKAQDSGTRDFARIILLNYSQFAWNLAPLPLRRECDYRLP
jgi:predicted outer membrane protein